MSSSGMNLRDALREWVRLGGRIRQGKGGEVVLSDPRLPHHRATINSRRKDCARCVTVMIRRLREVTRQ